MSNQRRGAVPAQHPSTQAASEQPINALTLPGDLSVRDRLLAGGLRGFTVRQMFPEAS